MFLRKFITHLKIAQSDDRYVSGLNKIYQFVWAVLGSARTAKRDATGPSCDHSLWESPIWRLGYQVTWTISKADTSLKRTVALVPRVSALERVDCKCALVLWGKVPEESSLCPSSETRGQIVRRAGNWGKRKTTSFSARPSFSPAPRSAPGSLRMAFVLY